MLILHNANIYTQDPQRPSASAIVLQGNRILATGSDQGMLAEFGERAERRDMQGKTIWPGLTDAHLHLEYYSLGLQKIDCETDTRAECLRRVAERAAKAAPGAWILGHGWNHNTWPEGFGSAADLDAVAPHNPVYLTAKSLHAGWANSAALRQAGIHAQSPNPEGGSIPKDASGQPSGILLESAMALVEKVLPAPTQREVAQAILEAQSRFWKAGLTGVHDYDRRRSFMALQQLQAEGKLGLRVVKSIPLEDLEHAVALGLRSGFGNDLLRIGSVKLFADGALGPRTAAMLQPYEGESEYRGMLQLDAEEIVEHGRKAAESGLSLAIHAIGDRANHEVLNAYARLRAYESENGLPALRHRIEHVQVIHREDVARLAELKIIASMQPIHATSDMLIADRHWGKRAELSYAWRTLLDRGIPLAFGSDAPVENPNPFWGLYAAVTRRRQDGLPGTDGWHPQQRLSLAEALRAYTLGPAYAAGMEDRLGKLAPGYYAEPHRPRKRSFQKPA